MTIRYENKMTFENEIEYPIERIFSYESAKRFFCSISVFSIFWLGSLESSTALGRISKIKSPIFASGAFQQEKELEYPSEKEVLANVAERSIRLADVRFFLRRLGSSSASQKELLNSFFPSLKPKDQKTANSISSTKSSDTETIEKGKKEIPIEVVQKVVSQIVKRELIFQYLKSQNKLVSESEIKLEIASAERAMGKSAFQQLLIKNASSRKLLERELQFSKSWGAFQKRVLDDKRLKKLFESNKNRFDGTLIKVAHILRKPESSTEEDVQKLAKEMGEIKAKITNRELRFEEAAEQHSIGSTKKEGGVLGWISFDGPMTRQFTDAAYQTSKGKVSEVTLSPHGFHLITVLEVRVGERPFESCREKVFQFGQKVLVHRIVKKMRTKVVVEFSTSLFAGKSPISH